MKSTSRASDEAAGGGKVAYGLVLAQPGMTVEAVSSQSGGGSPVASGPAFELLESKLSPPRVRDETVSRASLVGLLEERSGSTPIAVLSASARSEDHAAGLEAGADAYLNKPIDFAALAQLMQTVRGGRSGVRTAAETGQTAAAA